MNTPTRPNPIDGKLSELLDILDGPNGWRSDLERLIATECAKAQIQELEKLKWSHQTHMFSWHDIQDRIAELRRLTAGEEGR